jgi:hypothetical protein
VVEVDLGEVTRRVRMLHGFSGGSPPAILTGWAGPSYHVRPLSLQDNAR